MQQHPQTGAPPANAIPLDLHEEYASARPRSLAAFDRARRSLPGGQTRSVTHYAPFPTIIETGSGHTLRDLDGNEYLDLVNNYTSLVHGNAFEPVTSAVRDVLGRGTAFAAVHPSQIELAEQLTSRIAAVEQLRFTNSGSEAAALAARIARHFTGRSELIIAAGGYHGAVPPFTETGSDERVRLVPYNDAAALAAAVTDRTAAIFLEPFQGAGGVIVGDPTYLHTAQQLATQHGALFVLDEVQSLRNAPGGVQGELGLTPDLTLLGKVIGGGYPVGAVGGRADVLAVTSPYATNQLSHAGTFNGHLTSMVAGSLTLEHLDPAAISTLNRRAASLAMLIADAGHEAGIPISVARSGSVLNVYRGELPASASEAAAQPDFHAALHLALMLEGIYTSTRGMINLSTAIDDSVVAGLGRGYASAFARLSSAPQSASDRSQQQ